MFVAFLFFGAILFAIGHATRRQYARAIATPVTPVSSAGLGRASLHGRAVGDPADPAPITSRASAYWEAELWDTRWGQNRLPAARETSGARMIWLEDTSGRVPVLLHAAEWLIAGEDTFHANQTLPAAGAAFAERHGYRWDSGHVRLKERRIEQGESIHVLGVVALVAEVVQVLDRLKDSPLYRTVDSFRAQSSGTAAKPPDVADQLRRQFQPHDRIVWSDRQVLVISNRSPEAAARRLQTTARLCTVTAGVLFVLAVASLLLPT